MIGADGAMDMSGSHGFNIFTVAANKKPISASGMQIVPDFTFENAPQPKVVVIPAQGGSGEAMLNWIRNAAKNADMTMSVCTGAFVLAKTGLLSGKAATTHHGSYIDLAMQYPDIRVKRGWRFVDEGNIASSGGLTCGVDLAFHVVERYWGRKVALQTALNMEYQGKGWMDASGADNAYYAKPFAGLVCPVCGMPVDAHASVRSSFNGQDYYFCSASHKALFDKAPQAILDLVAHA
jgi:YHS domain-containing protein/putative intracellular protease/amidase